MQLATPLLTTYSCFGSSTWSATTAGSGQSVLSGVLAGFVFAGIVAVLGVHAKDPGREAARALKLLFCAFIGLAVASYLLADQAADINCLRSSSEEILAGGILGTFAIIMIVSLSWLIAAYDMHKHGVLRFLRHLLYVASAFVVLLLCTSSYSFLQADVHGGPPLVVVVWIYVAGGLFYGLGHPLTMRAARRFLAKAKLVRKSIGDSQRQAADAHRTQRDIVDLCAWVALSYLALAAIGDAFVLSTNDGAWEPPSAGLMYAMAWSSLVVPIAVLILATHALAPEPPSSDSPTGQT